jgi:hypothetical protein
LSSRAVTLSQLTPLPHVIVTSTPSSPTLIKPLGVTVPEVVLPDCASATCTCTGAAVDATAANAKRIVIEMDFHMTFSFT